jgi:ABC-type Mn2+/Zn2+ transport system ATPase subunit
VEDPVIPAKVVDAGTFMRSYKPLSYTIDGMLPSGYVYGLTGRRGHGKTAKAIAMTLAVASGKESILGRKVRQGRVAYVCRENPIDFKMKLAVTAMCTRSPMMMSRRILQLSTVTIGRRKSLKD